MTGRQAYIQQCSYFRHESQAERSVDLLALSIMKHRSIQHLSVECSDFRPSRIRMTFTNPKYLVSYHCVNCQLPIYCASCPASIPPRLARIEFKVKFSVAWLAPSRSRLMMKPVHRFIRFHFLLLIFPYHRQTLPGRPE